MTEHEDNRVHYLVEACEVRGHLDIKSDDLFLILKHQRELGKEDALTHIAEHDKKVIRNFAEWLLHSSIYHGICNMGFMYGCDASYAGHFHIADIYTVVADYEKEQKNG